MLRRIDQAAARLDDEAGELDARLVEHAAYGIERLVAPQVELDGAEPGISSGADAIAELRMFGREQPLDAGS